MKEKLILNECPRDAIQGTPQEIEVLLQNGGADIGIASERLSNDPLLVAFPWFRWYHSLLLPVDHPLNQVSPLTLEDVAKWPLITYRQGITGRSRIDEAFNRKSVWQRIAVVAAGPLANVLFTFLIQSVHLVFRK